ncbi:hypothetical protein MTO96_008528 [Rhipicephalus appendiculatus]
MFRTSSISAAGARARVGQAGRLAVGGVAFVSTVATQNALITLSTERSDRRRRRSARLRTRGQCVLRDSPQRGRGGSSACTSSETRSGAGCVECKDPKGEGWEKEKITSRGCSVAQP